LSCCGFLHVVSVTQIRVRPGASVGRAGLTLRQMRPVERQLGVTRFFGGGSGRMVGNTEVIQKRGSRNSGQTVFRCCPDRELPQARRARWAAWKRNRRKRRAGSYSLNQQYPC
jgi:hypothetical protein